MNQVSPASTPVVDGARDDPPTSEHSLPIANFPACGGPIVEGKRRNAKTPKRRKRTSDTSEPETSDGWQEKVQAHRKRQASVATILNRTFGRFAKSHPDLWERRAYLMLVGVMYQWLAANEKEVSTDELVSLSKMLAEQRRAEAQSHDGGEKETEATGGRGELPGDFGEAVKQIYGTNFQAPSENGE